METETTSPEGPTPGPDPIPPTDTPPVRLRHLVRGPGGPVGGVATGIANYFAVDPLVVQIAFVVGAIFGGAGILFYLAGWFLIPAYDKSPADRTGVGRIVAGSLGLIVGAMAVLSIVGGDGSFVLPLLVVGGGIYLLSQRPGESAALVGDVKDLLRPRNQPARPYGDPAAQSYSPDQGWATPRTDGSAYAGNFDPTQYPPPPSQYYAPRAPTVPREPGPPITAVVLALSAVVAGMMIWLNYATSLEIGAAAIFGSVLALCGAGLVVSAFTGRAWGLVPVGLIAALGVAVSPLADIAISSDGFGEFRYDVLVASDLEETYDVGAGELILDLTGFDLVDDQSVTLEMGAGSLVVILPQDMAVDVTAEARFGDVRLFEANDDGVSIELTDSYRPLGAPADEPVLTIDATTRFGEVVIRHEN